MRFFTGRIDRSMMGLCCDVMFDGHGMWRGCEGVLQQRRQHSLLQCACWLLMIGPAEYITLLADPLLCSNSSISFFPTAFITFSRLAICCF
jgi:hypothetical protein